MAINDKEQKSHSKKIIIAVIITVFTLWYGFDLNQYASLEQIKTLQQTSGDYIAEHRSLAMLIFFVSYVVITGFSLPGAVLLTLLGGGLFGFGYGLLLISFASSIGATLAFLVSRYLLRDYVQKKFGARLDAINKGVEKEGDFYLFSLRLIPVFPFFLINILMGLTKISTRSFYLVSQVGMLAGTAVYVWAGTKLSEINSLSGIASPSLLSALALLGIFPWVAKRGLALFSQRKRYSRWTKPKSFDRNMIVIGAGAGGLVSAYIAAAVKSKVTLVEKHRMGGDCLNTGCVPSKALIRSAHAVAEIGRSNEFGVDAEIKTINFEKVMGRIQQVIKTIEPHDSIARYSAMGVECLTAEAKIIDPWRVQIDEQVLTTKNIVVATGARPIVPPIPGLTDVPYLTSDTLWQLTEQPARLLVLGGGPIGCEIAQSFARLGSTVTQVEMASQLLGREDADAVAVVQAELLADGVNILLGNKVASFVSEDGQYSAVLANGDSVVFDQVFLALGRQANIRGFGLEALDVAITERGLIEINDYQQTSIPNIYAVGDVSGPYQLTHVAAHQAWFAAVNALFGSVKKFATDYRVIPAVTYTYPELARVGISENEAQQAQLDYQVTKYDIDDLDRAITDSETKGFVKVITAGNSDKILGVTIVASHAGELLAEYTLAMKYKLGLNKVLGTIHPYPTMSEANKYVAGNWKRNNSPEKLLAWVAKFHRYMRKA
ncbi:FAD-dependent oxidoreductase [Moritella sp. Urea-trap-13]|uniref:FAD-dependent oxidoreductase n=1 Tax=Moritella sp. Urea-trap-13 TaxID=2058327 RepID=UPI000C330A7B|nr:bifunctional TVP38/TMEM64 family protein/FAD-dependent oxidoreductase [Moritella sp. Urea-trap-13]PKH05887.1 pyridine nucleotide-disulfide oxidoreductase [Moritella sp. Urea-trap-13]